MTPDRPILLSKSRFLAGLQCLKRLYLDCHHRELADVLSSGQQAIFDTGHLVGRLARQRFPGGTLIDEQYFEHEQAEYRTQTLLRDPFVPCKLCDQTWRRRGSGRHCRAGSNVITVEVTAEDDSTTKTYTVTVTRLG